MDIRIPVSNGNLPPIPVGCRESSPEEKGPLDDEFGEVRTLGKIGCD
jgi:hypothetical protein